MTKYHDSGGQPISLIKELASSGEGKVWETNRSGYLAKIYHSPNLERSNKLQVMVANPPQDPTRSQNHISIAWPQDLLKDSRGDCVGFLMPAIRQAKELLYVYNPQHRLNNAPRFNWYYLHATAYNVALIVQALHAGGYVIGDMKSQNLLVNDRGLVSIIDTDSFQVIDPKTGKVHRCTVGSEGFTPAELLGKDLSTVNQTRSHDRFRLAVIIHLLLFGYSPFIGKWMGSGDSPEQNELVRQGFWLYGQNSPLQPSKNTIPLDVVHPEIKKLFSKCFNDGHTLPTSRPTAKDWCKALQLAIVDLTVCSQVANHSYSKTYGKCYWCERANILGADIFPPVSNASTPSQPQTQPQTQPQPQPPTKKEKSGIQRWVFSLATIVSIVVGANWGTIAGEYFYFWGTQKLDNGESEKALKNYEIAKRNNPDLEKRINTKLGDRCFILGLASTKLMQDYSKAIEGFQCALNLNPQIADSIKPRLAEAYYNQGLSKVNSNNYKEAIDDYTQAINFDPNSDLYYNERGAAYYNQGNFQAAIEDFNQAIKNAPDDAIHYFNKGNANYKFQNYEEAIEDYKTALSKNYNSDIINPKLATAYYNQALNKSNTEKYREAIDYYTQAIELDFKDENAYYQRGIAYSKIGKFQVAIDDYTQAIRLNSNNPYYYNQRGFAYYSQTNFSTAINDYTKAIEIDYSEPTFYTNRGSAYENLGNIRQAILNFQKAADLYLQQGNTDEYGKRINKLQLLKSKLTPSPSPSSSPSPSP